MSRSSLLFILFFSVSGLQSSYSAEIRDLLKKDLRLSGDFDHAHQSWTLFLKKYVTVTGPTSTVDYKSIKKDPKELNDYLGVLEAVSKTEFDRFSENEKLAFLINAYNAFTVKLIVDHYPVKSIKDIGSLFTSSWKKKFFHLLGQKRHLDDIEHDMIRKWFKEPRIHFAVVCASVGCPALRHEAYVATKLNEQLEDAVRGFIGDKSRNRYLPEKQKLELSSIFKWYGEDFIKKFGSLEAYLAERMTNDSGQQKIIREGNASSSYLDYNWSLNDKN